MKARFITMVKEELEHAKAGRPAHIVAKMNSLEDVEIINELYDASRAGVKIDLIVRGFCCLRPGVPGTSENIRVVSIIGRYLEHSRVFYFRSGAADELQGRFYIGSADWMFRNLNSRVEVVTPVLAKEQKEKLWRLFTLSLKEKALSWELTSSGQYTKLFPEKCIWSARYFCEFGRRFAMKRVHDPLGLTAAAKHRSESQRVMAANLISKHRLQNTIGRSSVGKLHLSDGDLVKNRRRIHGRMNHFGTILL